MQCCKITLGRLIWIGRRNLGLSQRELAAELKIIDYILLSKIENDRIEIRGSDYDFLIDFLVEFFKLDREYVETIRQQTEPEPRHL
jgi:transcriptional regulator with XRE-family HTH domain